MQLLMIMRCWTETDLNVRAEVVGEETLKFISAYHRKRKEIIVVNANPFD